LRGALPYQVLNLHVIDRGQVLELVNWAQINRIASWVKSYNFVSFISGMSTDRVRITFSDINKGVGNVVIELTCCEEETWTKDINLSTRCDCIEILYSKAMN
jgi:hypothetical protein